MLEKPDFNLIAANSHLVQYQVDSFNYLANHLGDRFSVIWCGSHGLQGESFDPEFQKKIIWSAKDRIKFKFKVVDFRYESYRNSFFRNRLSVNQWLKILLRKDVFLIFGWNHLISWQLWFASFFGSKLVMRAESGASGVSNGWRAFARKSMLRILFSRVEVFFVVSSKNRALYAEVGVDQSKLVDAFYGANYSKFFPIPKDKARAEESEFSIGFVGKAIEKKRPLLILSAFYYAFRQFKTRVCLHIVGTGPLIKQMIRELDKLGFVGMGGEFFLTKNSLVTVKFRGFISDHDINEAYNLLDVAILLSDSSETWGLALSEAAAAGCIPICSEEVGCANDLVAKVDHKLVCSARIDAVVETLQYAFEEQERLRSNVLALRSEGVFDSGKFDIALVRWIESLG